MILITDRERHFEPITIKALSITVAVLSGGTYTAVGKKYNVTSVWVGMVTCRVFSRVLPTVYQEVIKTTKPGAKKTKALRQFKNRFLQRISEIGVDGLYKKAGKDVLYIGDEYIKKPRK